MTVTSQSDSQVNIKVGKYTVLWPENVESQAWDTAWSWADAPVKKVPNPSYPLIPGEKGHSVFKLISTAIAFNGLLAQDKFWRDKQKAMLEIPQLSMQYKLNILGWLTKNAVRIELWDRIGSTAKDIADNTTFTNGNHAKKVYGEVIAQAESAKVSPEEAARRVRNTPLYVAIGVSALREDGPIG